MTAIATKKQKSSSQLPMLDWDKQVMPYVQKNKMGYIIIY
jgi:hypothetical protein